LSGVSGYSLLSNPKQSQLGLNLGYLPAISSPLFGPFKYLHCELRVLIGIILLKLKLWVYLKYFIDNWEDYTQVRTLIYRLPILLPKRASMSAIFTGYRAPEHPFYLPLVTVAYTIFVIDFIGPPSSPDLSIFTRLCPGFVTPKNTIPLLVRPVLMFLSPGK
jgi:hypothetical protein